MPKRNEIEVVIKAKNEATTELNNFSTRLDAIGSKASSMGQTLTTFMAPVALALGVATVKAVDFDTAMTNTGAVLGKSRAEMAGISAAVLEMGTNSRFGGTQAMNAMYDIASGVLDASTHMAVLDASIKTATAGNANLETTTNALIDAMNSYGFSAKEAGFASDVLSRTVALGKGTMDDFAAALPQAASLASSLGIEFDDLGAAAAYLTTKGNTASAAITQISAMMTAMMNPNETMKKGLKELGFESGEAAIQALGLSGAYTALADTTTANTDGMAKMVGSVEAIRGATVLATPAFQTFSDTFTTGLNGATAAAMAIQEQGLAQQFGEIAAQGEKLSISVGSLLAPILLDLVNNTLVPLGTQLTGWIQANPELSKGIFLVVGGLIVLGPVLMLVGTAISVVSGLVAAATGIYGLLSGGVTILSGLYGILTMGLGMAAAGFGTTGAAAWALAAPMMAAIAPILAVGAAVLAVVGAVAKFMEVAGSIAPIAGEAIGTINEGLSTGRLTGGQVARGVGGAIAAENLQGNVGFQILSAISPGLGLAVNGLQGRESGGPVMGGTPYMVGEAGPELFVPRNSGTIVPNGAMGATYNITVNVPMEMAGSGGLMNNVGQFADAIGRQLAMRGG